MQKKKIATSVFTGHMESDHVHFKGTFLILVKANIL